MWHGWSRAGSATGGEREVILRFVFLFMMVWQASAAPAPKAPTFVRGKIFKRGADVYISADPTKAIQEYKIKWIKGFTAKKVCYFSHDTLCPDYVVYFRHLKTKREGQTLVDAYAEAKF